MESWEISQILKINILAFFKIDGMQREFLMILLIFNWIYA